MTSLTTITPFTCEFPEPLALNPLEIHRHDHEERWIITHGNPVHSIDFSSTALAAWFTKSATSISKPLITNFIGLRRPTHKCLNE